jgi:hypothetical protein
MLSRVTSCKHRHKPDRAALTRLLSLQAQHEAFRFTAAGHGGLSLEAMIVAVMSVFFAFGAPLPDSSSCTCHAGHHLQLPVLSCLAVDAARAVGWSADSHTTRVVRSSAEPYLPQHHDGNHWCLHPEGGQFAFVEIITSMRRPMHFPRASFVSLLVLVSAYFALGSVGYWSQVRLSP